MLVDTCHACVCIERVIPTDAGPVHATHPLQSQNVCWIDDTAISPRKAVELWHHPELALRDVPESRDIGAKRAQAPDSLTRMTVRVAPYLMLGADPAGEVWSHLDVRS